MACSFAQELLAEGYNTQKFKDMTISIKRYKKLGLDNEQITTIIKEDYDVDENEIRKML